MQMRKSSQILALGGFLAFFLGYSPQAWATQSKLFSQVSLSVSSGATRYIGLMHGSGGTLPSNESDAQIIMPTAGTLRKLRVTPPSGAGATNEATFMVK